MILLHVSEKKLILSSTILKYSLTHQVVDAQQERLDAAAGVSAPAQVNPHQLRQELQREAAQTELWTAVQLKQLMAHGLQELSTQEEMLRSHVG